MSAQAPAGQRSANVALERLRRRSEFVRAAKSGLSCQAGAFKLQAARRESDGGPPRFGFTVTKKTGNAVARNRIRRRLREALRRCGPGRAHDGHDYVFIARREALTVPFPDLVAQMAKGLARLEAGKKNPHERNSKGRP